MKILNCYCGIGGNRKEWGEGHDITAVELNPGIAKIYQDLCPSDKVIVGDANKYILENCDKFDFIWSSPPCPTHSVTNYFLNAQGVKRYPDMKLYEEIIYLENFFKGKYVIENVKSYYNPLITPQVSGRHYFWSNFKIPKLKVEKQIGRMNGKKSDLGGKTQAQVRTNNLDKLGFDLSKYSFPDKDKLLRNCVSPDVGKAILESALNIYDESKVLQIGLFERQSVKSI